MANFDKNLAEDIERNEAWLARYRTPEASPELVARIKGAVRTELAKQATRRPLVTLRPWHGSFAAAAMLAICAGVAWYSVRHAPDARITVADSAAATSSTTATEPVPDEIDALFSTFAETDTSLSDLDELAYDDAWSLDGVSLYSALDDAFNEDASQSGGGDEGNSTSMRKGGVINAAEVTL